MSRRRVRPRQARGSHGPPPPVESKRAGEFHVRPVTGARSVKTYTCPGCHRPITPATPHLVVWPVERSLLSADALEERRHWHTACWRREP